MTEVIAYRRFIGPNLSVDPVWMPIGRIGCRAVSQLWVNALNKGDYVRIELQLQTGEVVKLKKLSPAGIERRALRRAFSKRVEKAIAPNRSPVFDPFERG